MKKFLAAACVMAALSVPVLSMGTEAQAASPVPFPGWPFPTAGGAGASAVATGFAVIGVGVAAIAVFGITHPHGMAINVSNPYPNPFLPSATCQISQAHRKCSGNPPR
jgi:hypothetical protein